MIKIIAALRRRAGMTRTEYLACIQYLHGTISTLRIAACVCGGLLGLLAVAGSTDVVAAAPRTGEQVYATTCALCHGRHIGPGLLGRQLTSETVRHIVRHGLNAMPAFRPTEITEGELDAVATYLQSADGRK